MYQRQKQGSAEEKKRGIFVEWGMRWGQRAAGEEKERGGPAPAATAFRHVTFLFTSGCNTHAAYCWLSLAPFHRHIRSKGLWPVYGQGCVHRNTWNLAHNSLMHWCWELWVPETHRQRWESLCDKRNPRLCDVCSDESHNFEKFRV